MAPPKIQRVCRQTMEREVPYCRLEVARKADASYVVVLRGDGYSAAMYDNFVRPLAEKGFSVITIDYADHCFATYDKFVEDVREVIAEVVPKGRIYFFGHSSGANIAVDYIVRYSAETNIAGAILLGAPLDDSIVDVDIDMGEYFDAIDLHWPGQGWTLRSDFARKKHLSNQLTKEEYEQSVFPLRIPIPYGILLQHLTGQISPIDPAQLQRMGVPFVAVYGEEDNIVKVRPEAREEHPWLRIVPGAPHNAARAPNWPETAKIIERWIVDREESLATPAEKRR